MLFLCCLIRICLYEQTVQTERKCAIGPAIDHGFYYDFEFGFAFAEEHRRAVEEIIGNWGRNWDCLR